MLLLIVLAVARAPRRRSTTSTSYLAVAAAYGSANHAAALQEIRQWPSAEDRLRSGRPPAAGGSASCGPDVSGRHPFGTVEAAVLMHAEAGLVALQSLSLAEAEVHLGASTTLFEWSRHAAARRGTRPHAGAPRRTTRALPPLAAADPREDRPPGLLPGPGRRGPRHRLPAHGPSVRGEGAPGRAARSRGAARVRLRGREPGRGEAPPAPRVGGGPAARQGGRCLSRRPGHRAGPARGPAPPRQAPPRRGTADRGGASPRGRRPAIRRPSPALPRPSLPRAPGRGSGRPDDAALFHARALEAWPDSQAARLALAHVLERSTGPGGRPPSRRGEPLRARRLDRAADPWWLYPFGPPGLASAALDRVWQRALDR